MGRVSGVHSVLRMGDERRVRSGEAVRGDGMPPDGKGSSDGGGGAEDALLFQLGLTLLLSLSMLLRVTCMEQVLTR